MYIETFTPDDIEISPGDIASKRAELKESELKPHHIRSIAAAVFGYLGLEENESERKQFLLTGTINQAAIEIMCKKGALESIEGAIANINSGLKLVDGDYDRLKQYITPDPEFESLAQYSVRHAIDMLVGHIPETYDRLVELIRENYQAVFTGMAMGFALYLYPLQTGESFTVSFNHIGEKADQICLGGKCGTTCEMSANITNLKSEDAYEYSRLIANINSAAYLCENFSVPLQQVQVHILKLAKKYLIEHMSGNFVGDEPVTKKRWLNIAWLPRLNWLREH